LQFGEWGRKSFAAICVAISFQLVAGYSGNNLVRPAFPETSHLKLQRAVNYLSPWEVALKEAGLEAQ
jgi:hypothetical protein